MPSRTLHPILSTLLVAVLSVSAFGQGFALLNFPDQTEIEMDRVFRWSHYERPQQLVLTYAIDDGFLADSGLTREQIEEAVESALESWTEASNGFVRFVESEFPAALNTGDFPPSEFVGPPLDLWIQWATDCMGDSECIAALPQPGWGAHIDFISRPPGFNNYMGGFTWQMTESNLGFAAYFRDGQTEIRSVDIILNEKWEWTTDPEIALQKAQVQGAHSYGCTCAAHRPSPDKHPVGRPSTQEYQGARTPPEGNSNNARGLSPTFDLETVLVHEIGHALGLDHPNEVVENGSTTLDPWVFAPLGGNSNAAPAIMYSDYSGVKRDLTNDDLGGLAYLYRPAWGDVDADTQITIADWFNAYNFVAGIQTPDAYDVNVLDLAQRDGVLTLDEISILTGWLSTEIPYPLNARAGSDPFGFRVASEVSVRLEPRPVDIGLGGAVAVDVYVDNPFGREIRGYDINVLFDDTLFMNPTVLYHGLIPDAVSIPPSVVKCQLRFGEVATFTIPESLDGLVATLYFEFDLPQAVAQMTYQFDVASAIIPVTDPVIHNFGMSPVYPDETLTLLPAIGFTNDYDVNDSAVIDLEDAYDLEQTHLAHDVDQDGDRDVEDVEKFYRAIRSVEIGESLGQKTTP